MRLHPKRIFLGIVWSMTLGVLLYVSKTTSWTKNERSKWNDKRIVRPEKTNVLNNVLMEHQARNQVTSKQTKLRAKLASTKARNLTKMEKIHNKIYYRTTDKEVEEYYSRERISERKYNRVLDFEKDRYLLSTLFPNPDERNDRVTDQLRLKLNVKEKKTILIWSGDSSNNEKKLHDDNCNVKECLVTRDHKKVDIADVVFVYGGVELQKRPINAKPNQTWVGFQIESAKNYPTLSKGLKINWTATYRRDSVLNAPYERFTPYLNASSLPRKPLRNFAKGKSKLVAWFVSNCGSSNGRLKYAKELQKHIPIDIYGSCGPLKCIRTHKDCFKKLQKDYKFYLSFENTNCKDYITEKLFWNAYQNDVIPVVMGAHPDNYKDIAPPRSFMHVDQFESPKHLADYLKFLDKHDDFYNSYFLWKGTGEYINTKFMCRLCAMAHLAPHFPMWYENTNQWWNGPSVCQYGSRSSYSTWKGKSDPAISKNTIKYSYNRTSLKP